MSDAVVFLVLPFVAALLGSVLLWLWSRRRRPAQPGFHEQLRAIAPDERSRPHPQPSGIVRLDEPPVEET
ncbi:MAG: hypothetical protein AAF081_18370 [Actinomycetota bacterium]